MNVLRLNSLLFERSALSLSAFELYTCELPAFKIVAFELYALERSAFELSAFGRSKFELRAFELSFVVERYAFELSACEVSALERSAFELSACKCYDFDFFIIISFRGTSTRTSNSPFQNPVSWESSTCIFMFCLIPSLFPFYVGLYVHKMVA